MDTRTIQMNPLLLLTLALLTGCQAQSKPWQKTR